MSNDMDKLKTTHSEIPIIEADFRHLIKYCCCCSKLIHLYFVLTKDNLIFYTNQDKKQIFKLIPRKSVLAINKRQINKYDVFMISIYYEIEKEKIIEFKIKTTSRVDTDRWLSILRKEIQTKKYDFKYDKTKYEDASSIYPFEDTKKFYLALCHLEYIIASRKIKNVFDYLRNEEDKKGEKDNLIKNEKGIDVEDIGLNIE
jgi:hypothetical protein